VALYSALAGTWVILAVLLQAGARIHSAGFSAGVSPWTYLLNQTVMLVRYLRLAVWPNGLVVNYGWPRPLALVDVLPAALLIVALIALTGLALRRRPMLGFLGAWFFLTLAPTSSILPIATEVGAERRMYLPLIALVALALIGLARLATGSPAAALSRWRWSRSSRRSSAPRRSAQSRIRLAAWPGGNGAGAMADAVCRSGGRPRARGRRTARRGDRAPSPGGAVISASLLSPRRRAVQPGAG
jgi:hypothetical protein